MNRVKETICTLGQPGKVLYNGVRRIVKDLFPPDWAMDTKSIYNFLVKCRVYYQQMEAGNDLSLSVR